MQWHTPIGYEISDGKIVINEEHSKTVKWIFQEYDSGISTGRIAQVLIDRKIPNSHDRVAWTCIFRKNRALAPHERSAVPLGTDHCPVG